MKSNSCYWGDIQVNTHLTYQEDIWALVQQAEVEEGAKEQRCLLCIHHFPYYILLPCAEAPYKTHIILFQDFFLQRKNSLNIFNKTKDKQKQYTNLHILWWSKNKILSKSVRYIILMGITSLLHIFIQQHTRRKEVGRL